MILFECKQIDKNDVHPKDIESLQYVTEVEHSAVRDVHSAAPPTTHVTKQVILKLLLQIVLKTVLI